MTQASRECARIGCLNFCCGRSRPVAAISKIDMAAVEFPPELLVYYLPQYL
jgi:hypothetical protein